MKIRKDIRLDDLEQYGYRYSENTALPTYRKTKVFGNSLITIDILIANRTIYINKSDKITERNNLFIQDLIKANFIEKQGGQVVNTKMYKQYLRIKREYIKIKEEIVDLREDLHELDNKSEGTANYSDITVKLMNASSKPLNMILLKDKLQRELRYKIAQRNSTFRHMQDIKKEFEEHIENLSGYDKTEMQVFYYYNVVKKRRTLEDISYILDKDYQYIKNINSEIHKKLTFY